MKRATTLGYMFARHNKPKKIVFHSRLLPHETSGMKRMQQSCKDSQNFAAKASLAFGKFYRFSDSTPIDVSSSNVINGSTTLMPFDKFVDMKISRGCRNRYLPFWWLSRRTRSCRVTTPLQPDLVRKHSGRIPERAAKSLMSPLEQKAQKTTCFSQAPRSVLARSRS
jgi:hypothetical protein